MLVRGAYGVERSGWRCVAAMALVASGGAHASTADAAPTAEHAGPYEWRLPPGFPTPAVPADNPMSAEKVALGRRLFFEPRLSVTGRYSCSSCHDPARAFTDGRAVAVGATGQTLTRSAMSLVNAAYNISFGWTKAEVLSLEQQMLEPLLNQHPVEMGLAGREAEVSSLLAADPQYSAEFAAAFPRVAETGAAKKTDDSDAAIKPRTANADAAVTFDRIVKAIAAFERTLIAGNSPFDRYVFRGEHDALSAQEKLGMELFYSPRAGCGACHSGFNFSGNWRDSQGVTGESVFANNGVGNQPMRVHTLRNIALTAPYMHDGRFATLEAVLDHYASVAQQPASDPKLRTFNLSPDERADVIAFLHALTDSAGR
jgi:cytochrome c peroxidase